MQSLAITLQFIYHIMSLNIWKSFGWNGPLGYFWKAAVCLLLSLRVILYPVLKTCICSPISKGWTTRMPEQVKSGRTHQYLRNLWLLSFLSCCTERRGSLSPWAEQALTSYLGRPPHSRQIQLDTRRVDKLEGLEHVQDFIQNRQVNETWWMGKYTLLLFFTTSYSHRHEQTKPTVRALVSDMWSFKKSPLLIPFIQLTRRQTFITWRVSNRRH